MKHQADSSIWKSLAVAFGDGVAFGVGMKIAQAAPRSRQHNAEPAAELPQPAAVPLPYPHPRPLRLHRPNRSTCRC